MTAGRRGPGLLVCSRAARQNRSLEHVKLVSLDGLLDPLGMQIWKFSGEFRDGFDHFLDHVTGVHASGPAPDESRNHFSRGGTLGEVDLVIKPAEGILRHRLVESPESETGAATYRNVDD
jgi:hypothetical protein